MMNQSQSQNLFKSVEKIIKEILVISKGATTTKLLEVDTSPLAGNIQVNNIVYIDPVS